MTLPANRHAEAGQRAAEQSAGIFQSPKFQEKLHCEQQQLEQEVFSDVVSRTKRPGPERKTDNAPPTARIYLFLSSSMPEETVRTYIATIARAKEVAIVPVLRGLVKGMGLRASAGYFNRILLEDPDCRDTRGTKCRRYQVPIRIDPLLFESYEITRVPTLVYAGDKDTFLIQGDAGLVFLLERINREAQNIALTNLIDKLRGNS